MGQDGPRGASSRPRPEQILDIKGTRQRRIAELGAGNQRPVDPPVPPQLLWVSPFYHGFLLGPANPDIYHGFYHGFLSWFI